MAAVKAEVHVAARNGLGQFIKECEVAGGLTVQDMVDMGAAESRRQAPVGHKHDRRSIPLRESIHSEMTGRTSGRWVATARHAMFVEKGTGPHEIVSSHFSFFWENAGRMWIPGLFQTPDIINHPGTPAEPYLEPAYHKVMARWRALARRHYPG